MTEKELSKEYFDWMYQLICDRRYLRGRSYRRLLNHLNHIDFQYIMPMDGNRAEDGIDLRYRFGRELDYPEPVISSYLDIRPCSVLEMLVALAKRCEEQIMDDPDIGNRTSLWFWRMIDSLGLSDMIDSRFDPDHTDEIIFRFMDRKYNRNGKGGLFTINHCREDMRNVEIWFQMNWYIDSIL